MLARTLAATASLTVDAGTVRWAPMPRKPSSRAKATDSYVTSVQSLQMTPRTPNRMSRSSLLRVGREPRRGAAPEGDGRPSRRAASTG